MGSGVPGTTGTPAATAARRPATLSPRLRIISPVGPMKAMPAFSQASAKSAFSARNPYPGWMASTPTRRASSTISSMPR